MLDLKLSPTYPQSVDKELRQYRCIIAEDYFRIILYGYRGHVFCTLHFTEEDKRRVKPGDGDNFVLPRRSYESVVDILRNERPLFYRGQKDLIIETLAEPVGESE